MSIAKASQSPVGCLSLPNNIVTEPAYFRQPLCALPAEVSDLKLAPQHIWRPFFLADCTPEPLTSSLVLQLLLLWRTLGAILRRDEFPMLLHYTFSVAQQAPPRCLSLTVRPPPKEQKGKKQELQAWPSWLLLAQSPGLPFHLTKFSFKVGCLLPQTSKRCLLALLGALRTLLCALLGTLQMKELSRNSRQVYG